MQLAQGHRYRLGVAKQTVEGTPATTAEYVVPAYGGGIAEQETRNRHENTDNLAYRRGGFKSRHHVEGAPVLQLFPDSALRLIHAALGSDTVVGAADPYTHTLVRADTRPWMTFWKERPLPGGTSLWTRYDDCRVTGFELQWASGMPFRSQFNVLGKKARGNVAAPTITTENKLDSAGPFYTAIGSVLKLDLDATPASTVFDRIESFTFRASYEDAELVQTTELWPSHEDLGLWSIGFSADILLTNYEAYLATFYGSPTAADADPSTALLAGSVDFTIPVGPVANADRTMQILAPALEFNLTPPDPDPSGRGVRATLTAELQHPGADAPLSIKVKNALSAAA